MHQKMILFGCSFGILALIVGCSKAPEEPRKVTNKVQHTVSEYYGSMQKDLDQAKKAAREAQEALNKRAEQIEKGFGQ